MRFKAWNDKYKPKINDKYTRATFSTRQIALHTHIRTTVSATYSYVRIYLHIYIPHLPQSLMLHCVNGTNNESIYWLDRICITNCMHVWHRLRPIATNAQENFISTSTNDQRKENANKQHDTNIQLLKWMGPFRQKKKCAA